MADGPSRKRPLDTQATVWVVMRSVKVPNTEYWGAAPHVQTALSGVFATKELAEKASAQHQNALAVFCERQSKELKSEKKALLRRPTTKWKGSGLCFRAHLNMGSEGP